MKNYKVEIVNYDPRWILIFKNESRVMHATLKKFVKRIHHIGSTAIPGMSAKPIIDILLEVPSIDEILLIERKLLKIGFGKLSRSIVPHRSFITQKIDGAIRFNLHIYEVGDPQVRRHVNFRDYLIHHAEDARLYMELKIRLAKKFNDNVFQYVRGKEKFVRCIDSCAKKWADNLNRYFLQQSVGKKAKYWSNEKIVNSMEANLNIYMSHFAQYLKQVKLIRIPGFSLVNSGLLNADFNYVFDISFPDDEVEIRIKEVSQNFMNKKIPFTWWIDSSNKSDNLVKHLHNMGFGKIKNIISMYLNLDSYSFQSSIFIPLKIKKVKNIKTWNDFISVYSHDIKIHKKYFSWIENILSKNDPIEYYVGYINEKAVVCSISVYYAGVAGIYSLKTTSNNINSSYNSIMCQFQVMQAKKLGYHICVIQTFFNNLLSSLQNLGFIEIGVTVHSILGCNS